MLQGIKPHKFFFVTGLTLGILYNLLFPPFQTPDEFNHFCRAWQISEGKWMPEKKDQRVGGTMPASFYDFFGPFRYASTTVYFKMTGEIRDSVFNMYAGEEKRFFDFPNTANYTPVSYIPHVFMIKLLSLFNVSLGGIYYGTRIFIFLFWLFAMTFIVKEMPANKWLTVFLLLLPTHLMLSNSFSADTVTNILCFLFLMLVYKAAVGDKKFDSGDLLLLLLVAVLLALAKIFYAFLVVLIFIVPLSRFKNNFQGYIFRAAIIIIPLTLAYVLSLMLMDYSITYHQYNPAYVNLATLYPDSDYHAQLAFLKQHPFHFFKALWNGITDIYDVFLRGYIGTFGAFLGYVLPEWTYYLAYVFLAVIAFSEFKPGFSSWQRIIPPITAAGTFIFLMFSLYLTWDPVGANSISIFQGRYMIPLIPLLLFFVPNLFKKLTPLVPPITVSGIIFINAVFCITLFQRYIHNPYERTVISYCDAEKAEGETFACTSSELKFNSCGALSTSDKRSGKHSAVVSAKNPYCFGVNFPKALPGDLVEMEVWRKGEGAVMVLVGRSKDCKEYTAPFDSYNFEDKNGWKQMHYHYKLPEECKDSLRVAFFVYNFTENEVYIDDVKLTLYTNSK